MHCGSIYLEWWIMWRTIHRSHIITIYLNTNSVAKTKKNVAISAPLIKQSLLSFTRWINIQTFMWMVNRVSSWNGKSDCQTESSRTALSNSFFIPVFPAPPTSLPLYSSLRAFLPELYRGWSGRWRGWAGGLAALHPTQTPLLWACRARHDPPDGGLLAVWSWNCRGRGLIH